MLAASGTVVWNRWHEAVRTHRAARHDPRGIIGRSVTCRPARVGVHFTPGSHPDALVQPHHPIHPRGEAFIVRGDQRAPSPGADQARGTSASTLSGGRLVQIAGGFVGKHQRRPVGERAGNGDALLLAA